MYQHPIDKFDLRSQLLGFHWKCWCTVEVAHYAYDTTGHLVKAWDPRISPNLTTTYSYDGNGRLATLTAPGLATTTFGHDSLGRISTISHPDPSGPTATNTIVYGDKGMTTISIYDRAVETWLRWPIRAEIPSALAIGLAGLARNAALIVSVAGAAVPIICIVLVNSRILVRPGQAICPAPLRSQPRLFVALNVWAWTGRTPNRR